jgi:hypothetical protein
MDKVRLIQGAALLSLCAAHLQGGLVKLLDFDGAIAEMAHFGLQPAAPMATGLRSRWQLSRWPRAASPTRSGQPRARSSCR